MRPRCRELESNLDDVIHYELRSDDADDVRHSSLHSDEEAGQAVLLVDLPDDAADAAVSSTLVAVCCC